jgi:hypothetical protein
MYMLGGPNLRRILVTLAILSYSTNGHKNIAVVGALARFSQEPRYVCEVPFRVASAVRDMPT